MMGAVQCKPKTIALGMALLSGVCAAALAAVPQDAGWTGKISSVKSWRLPNTANGLAPIQSWLCTGSAPDGDIYVAGEDHATNSALYRLYQKDDTLRYVGDAKAASTAVDNWIAGETAEKFHTRPTWMNGVVYVATLDNSDISNAYLNTRGFHWYGYNIAHNTFTDLSATEPNGVGVPHFQLVTLAPDFNRNCVYGASIPTCSIVRYNVATGVTDNLGRPSQWTQLIYSNRFMFVDSRSRLYIDAGNENPQWNQNEPTSVYDHLYYYDPASGFGQLTSWKLQSMNSAPSGANALEVGQWNRDHTKCYVSDDKGHVYCFTDSGPSWRYLGHLDYPWSKIWVLDVSADEKVIYMGSSDYDTPKTLWMFDIATGTTTKICTMGDLDAQADAHTWITGYDAWDKNGNFYVTSFSWTGPNCILTRVNPVKIKVAKGLLPALVEVNASLPAGANAVTVTRTGATTQAAEILYDVRELGTDSAELAVVHTKVTIPAGSQTASVTLNQFTPVAGVARVLFSLVPDGNDYVVGAQRDIDVTSIPVRYFTNGATSREALLRAFKNGNGAVTIRMNVPRTASARVRIFDMSGKCVATLMDKTLAAGTYDIPWDGRIGGVGTAHGVFVVSAQLQEKSMQQKIIRQ
jgi:hypothetical protein